MIIFIYRSLRIMPVPNRNNETKCYKKQRRWSLVGILSKKKKFKKSQESVDFCPYDGKINNKVAQSSYLERSTDCPIEQYTCSPRQIRRCNSLQYASQVSPGYSNITSQPKLDEWKSSLQSIHSSNSSVCYSDIGVYKSYRNSNQSLSYYVKEEDEPKSPVLENAPLRCSSEIGHYQNKINYNQRYFKPSVSSKKLIGKKIPPPPPPRDPNVKAMYYFRNNRLMSRESDSTYFSQGSDDNIPDEYRTYENETECQNKYYVNEPPRSRRPIQICDVETLSSESENSVPRTQSVEEALQELEDIYNSLGLSDEDLLDRAERRDLPTLHQNMRYQSSDELDCITFNRVLPKTRRSGVPDIISDDMAYRRLNKKESKCQNFVPGSFLLVLPTVYNVDKNPKPSGEPDVTLDDVVFRNRRQHLNFFKVPDPQPPFGIPLGPIVGAAPSDYLHAVPEGRYKPSFHPRKIPDTVEDDLAFRALRKENKYKTCIDFSFIHRNPFKIDDFPLKFNNSRCKIKNDTHWILTKTPAKNSKNKNQAKFILDDLTDSVVKNRQNLMVVKINHHKPIMLSGFTLNEANLLSKSLFCTKLLQHESPRLCLTNDTYTPHSAPQLKSNRSLNALYAPNTSTLFAAQKPCSKSALPSKVLEMENKSLNSQAQFMKFDCNSLLCEDLDGSKIQPNFTELIQQEYVHRYLLPENQSNFVHNDRTANARRTKNKIKRSLTSSERASASDRNLTTCTINPKTENRRHVERQPQSVSVSLSSQANATEPKTGLLAAESSEENSSPSVSVDDVAPNCMPNYLEVCLYITVYIYQLFSVNAYSTLVALIFLVALHVCRRLS